MVRYSCWTDNGNILMDWKVQKRSILSHGNFSRLSEAPTIRRILRSIFYTHHYSLRAIKEDRLKGRLRTARKEDVCHCDVMEMNYNYRRGMLTSVKLLWNIVLKQWTLREKRISKIVPCLRCVWLDYATVLLGCKTVCKQCNHVLKVKKIARRREANTGT